MPFFALSNSKAGRLFINKEIYLQITDSIIIFHF